MCSVSEYSLAARKSWGEAGLVTAGIGLVGHCRSIERLDMLEVAAGSAAAVSTAAAVAEEVDSADKLDVLALAAARTAGNTELGKVTMQLVYEFCSHLGSRA